MSEPTLAPCPFCGAVPLCLHAPQYKDRVAYHLEFAFPHSACPASAAEHSYYWSREQCIEWWNHREPSLASLQSRLAEVERDAARYRWLREGNKRGAVRARRDADDNTAGALEIAVDMVGDDWDTAIDAALSAASVDGDKGEGK